MKSAVETLNPTRVKITIEVPFEDLKPNLDAAYKAIAKQVNIPGFRKGKVPAAVIDRQIGRGPILDEAINKAVPELYVRALKDNELIPLAQPDIDVTKLEDGEVLEFTAEVDIRPEIPIPAYTGIEAEVDDAVVTDEDVETQLGVLRERFATLNDVDRAAADGDLVTIDLRATNGGEDIEGGEVNGYSYKVGSDQLLKGIDEALVGLSAGGDATFTSQLLGGDLEGEDVDVVVKVHAVKEQVLPELDDDFAQEASEFDTVEELTEDVRTRLGRGKRLEQAAAARDAVLEKLLEEIDVPIPDALMAQEIEGRKSDLQQQLTYAGLTLEGYLDDEKQTIDEFEADLEKRVCDSITAQWLLDEIAKKEEINVEQEELSAQLFRRAQQSGQNPDDYIRHMIEHNHIPEVVAEVVRGKALALVVESAKVSDKSGAVIDLKNLRPDGTIGEPVDEAAEGTAAEEPAEV